MTPRFTFRQWSILVEMGENGSAVLSAARVMRRTQRDLLNKVMLDSVLHGTGVAQISMGEDCTPVFKRIDPYGFYVPPEETGE